MKTARFFERHVFFIEVTFCSYNAGRGYDEIMGKAKEEYTAIYMVGLLGYFRWIGHFEFGHRTSRA